MKRKTEPSRNGNGGDCIIPEHGASYVLPSGREWCPHQSHDTGKTSAWLDKQTTDGTQAVEAEAP